MFDLALINGKIMTMAEGGLIAEAVGVKAGRIVVVGSTEDIKQFAP